jgi:septal ring factor EnvC (AmiA/AmiB activator)
MKTNLIAIAFAFFLSLNCYAQVDSLEYSKAINQVNTEIEQLKNTCGNLSSSNENLKKKVVLLESQLMELKGESEAYKNKTASLEASISHNSESITASSTELNSKIDQTNTTVEQQSDNLNNRTIWGAVIALIILGISAILTLILHKKGSSKIEELKMQSAKINEEIVNKFATEMSDMQKISTSISALSAAGASADSEQDLIKSLADRITFMEMTLFKMDNTVKGHKQLTKSIGQMKDNLRASGYELVDMLGKPYSDGMKAVASFEDDENLPEGTRIITKIIKPQINYNGVMIQNAQITVSQNI